MIQEEQLFQLFQRAPSTTQRLSLQQLERTLLNRLKMQLLNSSLLLNMDRISSCPYYFRYKVTPTLQQKA